ncbi:MAG: hypothetical protein WC911_01495 [Thermoleophilia bacterium]
MKVSLIAVMAGALALVLILGASIGSAAAPNPALSDDLVLIGNGSADGVNGTGDVKVLDINSMSVVNTIANSSDGSGLANNHGVLIDGTGRYIWNSNNSLAAGKARLVKYDLATMSPVLSFDAASADVYAFTSGLCGLEWNNNDPSTGKLWGTSMSSATGNGGLYEYDAVTGATGNYVDNTAGADNGSTCGIAWNASGGTAYAAAMTAKKLTAIAWPGSTLGATNVSGVPTNLHMVDTNKANGYAYIAAQTKINIVDTATMTEVATVTPAFTANVHDTKVSHSAGFLYAHSRNGSTSPVAAETGTLLIYDIGGGGAGGTALAPVLIGQMADQGSSTVSCGTQLLAKSTYTAQPSLTLSKTGTTWGTYANYLARVLTVNYSVGNSGSNAALDTTIVGASSGNGVTLVAGASVGTIGAGSSKALALQYNVPVNVGSFMSTTYATAKDLGGTSYSYPGPYPGP